MKKLFTLATMSAFAFALPSSAFAAPKKETPATAPAADAKKPAAAAADVVKAAKPLPMHSRVDVIDAAGKTFTHKNADGKEVKFTVTATTEIKNGEAAAKFEDIKVGDFVSGLRLKKGENNWEIVKITKFGPAPAKKADDAPKKEMKKAAKKAE